MRTIAALLCLCLAGAAHATEEPGAGPDGFSICPLTDTDFGPCLPLTAETIARYRLSPAQQDVVRELQRLSVSPTLGGLKTLAANFAPRQPPIGTADYSDVWYPDRDDPRAACFVCGLHLRFAKGEMMQINYGVRGRFLVV
jgi:hypothetical protein